MSELETRITTRTKSPKSKKGKSKPRSSSSGEMDVSEPVPLTKSPSMQQQPLTPPSPPGVPKRSRSMGYDHNEALPNFNTDAAANHQVGARLYTAR